jgi:hypothetical protein
MDVRKAFIPVSERLESTTPINTSVVREEQELEESLCIFHEELERERFLVYQADTKSLNG